MVKVPQVPAMPGMAPLGLKPRSVDERNLAERRWRAPLKPRAEQAPCDVGLFSDDAKQLDLTIPDDLSVPGFLRRKGERK